MRQTKSLPLHFDHWSYRNGSLQVVASPCWEMVLPDVISADLSLDAWACIPAAHMVPLPISSHVTSAFPTFRVWVGASDSPLKATSCGAKFRDRYHSCTSSGLQVCSPSWLPPRSQREAVAQRWLLHPSRTRVVASTCIGYASRSNWAINDMRTLTS